MSETRSGGGSTPQDAPVLWHLWVDTGGTFTDCVALAPDGTVRRAKVLSDSSVRGVLSGRPGPGRLRLEPDWQLPDGFFRGAGFRLLGDPAPPVPIRAYRSAERLIELSRAPSEAAAARAHFEILCAVEAPILAAHWVTRTPLRGRLPPMAMRLATTRGTNALLERRGSPTALFTTRGFADLLLIGSQQRPELFTLAVRKAPPLYEEVVEVDERVSAEGEVLRPLDVESLRAASRALLRRGTRVAAVALMNSYRNPVHEELVASVLGDLGFRHVSCSSRLAPRVKILPRAETTVVNAYLADVIGDYLDRVAHVLEAGPLHVLTSAGGLRRDREYLPKDSLLSGPAGGVVGAAAVALQSGFERSLAFDMGGTSTDVSRYDGEFDYQFETRVGDAHLLAPCLAIETVAAGGGSICRFDGRQLKVGPQSAGASPGPACYGAGGPLTLTDVNLLLGRLQPASFEIPIDVAAAERAAADVLAAVRSGRSASLEAEELLQGLLDIANERMAETVRRISIRRGYRAGDYVLVAFGGAGGQHACALADILEIDSVLVPQDAGLLSAVGLGRARLERLAERQVLRPLHELNGDLARLMAELEQQAVDAVLREGVTRSEVETRRRWIHLRLEGQETSLAVEYDETQRLEELFDAAYEDHYGYRPAERRIEVESLRVIACSGQRASQAAPLPVAHEPARLGATRRAYVDGCWQDVPVFNRSELRPGHAFEGPGLVFERHCATLVEPGWRGRVDGTGALVLRRVRRGVSSSVASVGDSRR